MIERSSIQNIANLSKADSFNPHIAIIQEANLDESMASGRETKLKSGLFERTES